MLLWWNVCGYDFCVFHGVCSLCEQYWMKLCLYRDEVSTINEITTEQDHLPISHNIKTMDMTISLQCSILLGNPETWHSCRCQLHKPNHPNTLVVYAHLPFPLALVLLAASFFRFLQLMWSSGKLNFVCLEFNAKIYPYDTWIDLCSV